MCGWSELATMYVAAAPQTAATPHSSPPLGGEPDKDPTERGISVLPSIYSAYVPSCCRVVQIKSIGKPSICRCMHHSIYC